MKKLTAGIFATLLAVVAVDGAYAAIASKQYVDDQVDEVSQDVTTLSGTVSGHTTSIGEIEGTIETYGDIVTHNVDEFATAAEGDLANTAVQPDDITNVERTTNKTQTVDAQSTDAQYPSAKAVWTAVSSVDANASVEALEGRVDTLETASATHATKTELAAKQDKLTQTGSASQPVYVNAEGKVTAGNTIPTVTTTITTGQTAAAQAGAVADALATKANTSDLADYVTKEAADTDYAVKALETQVGTVSAENMGTTATTVVTAIKEVAGEAADAASAAAGAKTAADTAQVEVDALEVVVNNETTGLAAAHTAIDALESGKLDKTGTAARATADASGNVITTTYATKEEIADMATDTNLALKQDKTDNSLATTNKTVVGAINEVKTTADNASTAAAAAQEDATQAISDAADAQAEAEARIPKPSGECSNPTAKCVLVSNGTNSFEWEVIARGTSEAGAQQ